jgi:peptidoglycan/LPS O-acetylase OafA/YrhL
VHEAGFTIWLRCLTLTHALFPGTVEAGPPQTWTLTVEECFYFLVPFLVILCRGRSPWGWAPILTALFWGAGLCVYGPHWFLVQRTIFGTCFEFFAGMALAQWMSRRPRRSGGRLPIATFGGAAGIALGVYLLAICGGHRWEWTGWLIASNFYLPVVIALFFYGLMVERSPLAWLLASGPMVFCGRISYAFYLIHVSALNVRFEEMEIGLAERFALLMILSALLHLGVEEPLRRLIRGRSKGRVLPGR